MPIDVVVEVDDGAVDEGLEAGDLELLDVHGVLGLVGALGADSPGEAPGDRTQCHAMARTVT
jgi:hypothetical protein